MFHAISRVLAVSHNIRVRNWLILSMAISSLFSITNFKVPRVLEWKIDRRRIRSGTRCVLDRAQGRNRSSDRFYVTDSWRFSGLSKTSVYPRERWKISKRNKKRNENSRSDGTSFSHASRRKGRRGAWAGCRAEKRTKGTRLHNRQYQCATDDQLIVRGSAYRGGSPLTRSIEDNESPLPVAVAFFPATLRDRRRNRDSASLTRNDFFHSFVNPFTRRKESKKAVEVSDIVRK